MLSAFLSPACMKSRKVVLFLYANQLVAYKFKSHHWNIFNDNFLARKKNGLSVKQDKPRLASSKLYFFLNCKRLT